MSNKTKTETFTKKPKTVTILPLRDHIVKQNDILYVLKKGEEATIEERFVEVLQTEKVLSKG